MPTIYISDKDSLPKRREYDFYPTPIALCKSALEILPKDFVPQDILDPGAGDGVWGRALKYFYRYVIDPNLYGIEIRDISPIFEYNHWINADYVTLDYFKDEPTFDLIVGNPPYKYAEQFVDKSLSLLKERGYLLFLLKLSFLESSMRYNKYFNSKLNPKEVHICVQRVDFYKDMPDKPKGSGQHDAFAIYLWQKGYIGNTTLHWLSWR